MLNYVFEPLQRQQLMQVCIKAIGFLYKRKAASSAWVKSDYHQTNIFETNKIDSKLMILTPIEFATDLLLRVSEIKKNTFSGVGIVLYRSLENLPHMALGNLASEKPHLPVSGANQITELLFTTSDEVSPWHDGFHLIDAHSNSLTHLSQFLSPPLTKTDKLLCDQRPSGARQMAALLVSYLPGIECVGLLNRSGELGVYNGGILISSVKYRKNEST